MPVNVVMPQMGESVAEGTVVRWIKKVGDNVDRDEPLFEISTDKVDAEIPSPAAGTLSAIHVKEGETVPVDTVVALIAQGGEAVAAASATAPAAPASSSPSAVRRSPPRRSGVGIRRVRHRRSAPSATPQADGSPTKSAPMTSSASKARPRASRSGGGQPGSARAAPTAIRLAPRHPRQHRRPAPR